jgi:hypothetical protein
MADEHCTDDDILDEIACALAAFLHAERERLAEPERRAA